MLIRFLLLFGRSCSVAGGANRGSLPPAVSTAPASRLHSASDSALKTQPTRLASTSRTALDRAQLGSLLEGTGAGCVWFDYNNSGLPVSLRGERPAARRLDASVSAEGEAAIRRRTIISIATTATATLPT